MPQAQAKGDELMSRLLKLVQEEGVVATGKVEPLQLRMVRSEAEKLLKTDAFKARVVLGSYHAHRGNYEDSLFNHRQSLELDPNDWVATFNYGVDLFHFGDFVEAESLFGALSDQDHSDVESTYSAMECAAYSLQFRKCLTYLERLEKFSDPKDIPSSKMPQHALKRYKQEGVSDEDGAAYYETARGVLRRNGIHDIKAWLGLSEGLVIHWLRVNRDPEEIAELSEELAFALADLEVAPKISRIISLTYSATLPVPEGRKETEVIAG